MESSQKRVTRTIVIEGPADWVDMTLDPVRCLVPAAGDQRTFQGTIRCLDRTDEEINRKDEEQ